MQDIAFSIPVGPVEILYIAAACVPYPTAITSGPRGELYLIVYNATVRSIEPVMPGVSLEEIVIASEDGNELYLFDYTGRHLQTMNALTNTPIVKFHYMRKVNLSAWKIPRVN